MTSTTSVNYRLVFPLFKSSYKQLLTQNLKFNFLMKFRVIHSFPFKTYHLLKVQCFIEKLWYANSLPSQ